MPPVNLEKLSEIKPDNASWQKYGQGTFKESRKQALEGKIARDEDFEAQQKVYEHFATTYDACVTDNDG